MEEKQLEEKHWWQDVPPPGFITRYWSVEDLSEFLTGGAEDETQE